MKVVRSVLSSVLLLAIAIVALEMQAQCARPEGAILEVGDPDASGNRWVTIEHRNLDVSGTIAITWNGRTESFTQRPNPFGYLLGATCSLDSELVVKLTNSCDQLVLRQSLPLLNFTPTVSIEPEEVNGEARFHVKLFYPFLTERYVQRNFYPVGAPAEVGTPHPPTELDFFVSGYTPGNLEVIATACTREGEDEAASTSSDLDCQDCSGTCEDECRGDPVRTANGNLRLTETDPVPGNPVVPFQRVYNSRLPRVGWFGPGTTTFLDPVLYVSPRRADPEGTISLMDEGGTGYLFRHENGAYRQISPGPGSRPTTLVRNTGEWRHGDHDGRVVRVFNDAGRIMRYIDQRTGRATDIVYDGNGRPSAVQDSWGTWSWTLTFTAASTNRITRIAVDGHPTLVWTYTYGSNLNLMARVDSPAGVWRTYDLQPINSYTVVMTTVRDGLGNVIEQHAYDGLRATSSHGPSGEISQFTYELPGRVLGERVTRVTWLSGATEQHYLRRIAGEWRTVETTGGCASCGSGAAVYVHDSQTGNVLRQQDSAGYITESTYTASDRLSTRRTALKPAGCDPAAQQCRQSVEDLGSVGLDPTGATMRSEYTYGNALWPDRPTVIRTTGVLSGDRVESFTYHATSGETLQYSVTGATGQPVRQETRITTTSLYNGSEGAAFTPGGAFDPSWTALAQPVYLRRSMDGPRTDTTDVTTLVYYPIDSAVPMDWRGRLAASRNALGHITRYEDYDIFGNARRVVDPNGNVVETTHDGLGRLLTSKAKAVPGCNTTIDSQCATDLVSARTYYGAGPLATEVRPIGGVTQYDYDGRGRIKTVSRGPAATNLLERIETVYDPATGKKSVERVQAFESGAWVTKKSESYTYDSEARLAALTHADSTSVRYTYDARDQVLTVQDENHTTPNTFYTYDAGGRLTRVDQTLAAGTVSTAYAYDIAGNLTAVTDPNGNITTYLYDDFGQMLRQVSPVTGTTTYAYNVAGLLTASTDANGATTTRRYDALGRLLSTDSIRGTDREQVAWGYDGTGNLGRLNFMSDPTGYTAYYYTRFGQVRSEQKNIEGIVYTIQRHYYDPDGNIAAITHPSGRTFTYTYDYAGRPLGVTTPGATNALVSGARYLPFGPLVEFTYGSGDRKQLTYDSRYRVQTNELRRGSSAVASYAYQYDAAGNIIRIDDLMDAAFHRQFGYDDLGRLTSTATGALLWGTRTLTYDAMGNMKKSTLGATLTYSGSLPKLTSVVEAGVTTPVTYDPAGNELTATKTSTISPRNSIAQMSTAAVDYLYKYDGRGLRTWTSELPKPATGTTTKRYHFYTPDLHFLARTDYTVTATSTTVARSIEPVWFAGLPVAQIDYNDLSTLRYTFTDHLGLPVLQTSPTGAIIWQMEFEPYGRLYRVRTGKESAQPLRLPGQELTMDGKEYYNVFRWYRSWWGRYTQGDPLGVGGRGHFGNGTLIRSKNPQLLPGFALQDARVTNAVMGSDMNLFGYAAANPLSFTDPTGLETILCTVHRLTPFAAFRLCEYVGACIGTVSHDIYLTAGYVHVQYGCQTCSRICFYGIEGNTVTEPREFRCVPPMPIVRFSPSNPMTGRDPR